MADPTWKTLEERVRGIAHLTYGIPCNPGREAGVNVDAIVRLRQDAVVLIEITERDQLVKVRDDITKLGLARLSLASKGVFTQCFCVIDGEITPAMLDAGKDTNVSVVTVGQFSQAYFDFSLYKRARGKSTIR